MTIKINLSRLMGERKQNIADVIRATGLARNTLSGLYKEQTLRVDFETLDVLCYHFDCELSDLIEYVPESDGGN